MANKEDEKKTEVKTKRATIRGDPIVTLEEDA